MKRLIFLLSLVIAPAWALADDCGYETGVRNNDLQCGTLKVRCPGHPEATLTNGQQFVCTGNAIEYRVVYPDTCGPNRDEACGTSYASWTTAYNGCNCNRRNIVEIGSSNGACDGQTSSDATQSSSSCYD